MPELEQKSFQRQVAYKTRISDLLNGVITKDDISAGYIRMNGLNVSRASIIATVVFKSEEANYASAMIDDGTGRISLKSFENKKIFLKIDVGDAVLVVGKIRQYNDEKYIIPEIMKKIDTGWASHRKLELEKMIPVNESIKIIKTESGDLVEGVSGSGDGIYSLIKKMDNGDGVSVEDVIINSKNSKAEDVITKLLESGDIFEVKPGRLKVLE